MSPTINIFPILIVILILIGLIVGITLWVAGGRSKGTGEMACGGCGYAVRGLNALNCPECGADLRMVGINQPKGGAARNVGIALTIGTGLLLLTCMGSALFWVQGSSTTIQTGPTQLSNPSMNQSTFTPPVNPDVAAPEDEGSEAPASDDPPSAEETTP